MLLLSSDYWEIKNTKNKGQGLFAKKNISKGRTIGDYLGTVLHPLDAIVNEENFYLMYYHDHAVISPDLKKPGIHLLNHSCIPNAFLYIHKGHTLIFARRNILKGKELTIPYLLPPKDEFCNPCPHVCKCGNLKCTKTMHLSKDIYGKWRKFSEQQAKKTEREKVTFGKELSRLSLYPKKISEDYIKEINKLFGY